MSFFKNRAGATDAARSGRQAGGQARSGGTRAIWIAIIAISVVPLLYGSLYLAAFLDPYGHLDTLPVAVVNQDQGAEVEGVQTNLGNQLVDTMKDKGGLGWSFVDASTAQAGLENGTYYTVCTIPSDFTQQVLSAQTMTPKTASLLLSYNESESQLGSQLVRSAFLKVQNALNAQVVKEYWQTVFAGLKDSGTQLGTAATGARQLDSGIQSAQEGSATITTGLNTLTSGANTLESGLGTLASGTASLDTGAASLASGTQKLATASGQVASGAQQLADSTASGSQLGQGAQSLASGLSQAASQTTDLPAQTQQLASGAHALVSGLSAAVGSDSASGTLLNGSAQVASGLSQLSSGIGSAQAGVAQAKSGTTQLSGCLDQMSQQAAAAAASGDEATMKATLEALSANLGSASTSAATVSTGLGSVDTGLGSAVQSADALQQGASQVHSGLSSVSGTLSGSDVQRLTGGLDTLAAQSSTLAGSLSSAASGAQALQGGIASVNTGAESLAAGSSQVSSNMDTAASGAASLSAGASQVASGASSAQQGAGSLASGAQQLATGSSTLTDGLATAHSGASILADGLDTSVDAVNSQTANSDVKSEAMSEPVQTVESFYTQVKNYGTGFAPYFMAMALWVGCLVGTFVLKPLDRHRLMSGSRPLATAFAGYARMAALATVQAVLLLAVLQFGLQLQVDNVPGFYAFGVLTALVFAAFAQMLCAAFGLPGRFFLMILLMLQLTSSGGTFPVDMSPVFFQAISPWLPMTYVVEGMRQIMTGMNYAAVASSVAVLVAWGVASLLLLVLVARHQQRVVMVDLHPLLNFG